MTDERIDVRVCPGCIPQNQPVAFASGLRVVVDWCARHRDRPGKHCNCESPSHYVARGFVFECGDCRYPVFSTVDLETAEVKIPGLMDGAQWHPAPGGEAAETKRCEMCGDCAARICYACRLAPAPGSPAALMLGEFRRGIARGAADERARVVAWLESKHPHGLTSPHDAAVCIAAGEHDDALADAKKADGRG